MTKEKAVPTDIATAYTNGFVDGSVNEALKIYRCEMYRCFHCGGQVIWDSDFSYEDYSLDGEGIVHVLHCANCGATIEYYVPIDGEQQEDD